MIKPTYLLFFFASLITGTSLFAQTETEPNNKFEQCNSLTFGAHITGTINKANDSDLYCITVSKVSVLNLSVDHITGSAPITVHIFNPDKTYLGVYSASVGSTIDYAMLACGPGTYYFMVYETTKTMSGPTYRLSVTTHDADQYECNNSFTKATKVSATGNTNASIDYDNDEDYYEIDIAQTEQLAVTVNPVPSNIRIGLVLYDASFTKLTEATSSFSGATVSVNKQIQPGKYFVRLRSENISWSATQYRIAFTPAVITTVDDVSDYTLLNIYPNPTRTDLFIRFNNAVAFSSGQIVIYNCLGKQVYAALKPAGQNRFVVKRGALPAGIYLFQFIGEKKRLLKQFVIAD